MRWSHGTLHLVLKLPAQFVKFCVVGSLNTAIDFAIYVSLTRFFVFWLDHRVAASIMAFIGASLNSYLLNKRWTFRNARTDHHVLATKFLLVTGSSFLIYTVAFGYLIHLGFYDIYVKVGLIAFVLVWNFVLSKIWVYTKA